LIFFSAYLVSFSSTFTARQSRTGCVSAREFTVLRFSRLYPLHLATLVTATVLLEIYRRRYGASFQSLQNDPLHFPLQLFFASDWQAQRLSVRQFGLFDSSRMSANVLSVMTVQNRSPKHPAMRLIDRPS
jgi:peptidoglycan/LPS O-acetylase OafA/YrhL